MSINLCCFCVQLGRLGCHTSIGHEEEHVRQHRRSCRACAHGDSYWNSGEILSSTQNVMWSRFQSYYSWIRRFVLRHGDFLSNDTNSVSCGVMTCDLMTCDLVDVLWLQADTTVYMRYALFWCFMQHRSVSCYRPFGTTYRSHPQGSSSLKMGPIGCLETSVRNCRSKLCKIPLERRSLSAFMFVNTWVHFLTYFLHGAQSF